MTESQAFEIVMYLATGNTLDSGDVMDDPGLEERRLEQEEALEVARRFLAIHLHDSNTPTRPL